ncbi:hypothetical protein KLP28_03000 [Nocardioidaceae bacterium]|nr:hypothetical protein KLP28_03000 [Nocardioidaceae bacterium]
MSTSPLDTDPAITLTADLAALSRCECVLCDHSDSAAHDDAATWRLVWEFSDDAGDSLGEDTLLLCEHCCGEWLQTPETFGGQPLRVVPA